VHTIQLAGKRQELELALEIAVNCGEMTPIAAEDVRELERNLERRVWVVRYTGEEIDLEATPQVLQGLSEFIEELCVRYGTRATRMHFIPGRYSN
jgi:hypothetical protein